MRAASVSRAGRHRTVDEIWYFHEGRGEMWRRDAIFEEVVSLKPGFCLTIPAGTSCQFRSTGDSPLSAFAVTMPPGPPSPTTNGRRSPRTGRMSRSGSCRYPPPGSESTRRSRRDRGRAHGVQSREGVESRARSWRSLKCARAVLPPSRSLVERQAGRHRHAAGTVTADGSTHPDCTALRAAAAPSQSNAAHEEASRFSFI